MATRLGWCCAILLLAFTSPVNANPIVQPSGPGKAANLIDTAVVIQGDRQLHFNEYYAIVRIPRETLDRLVAGKPQRPVSTTGLSTENLTIISGFAASAAAIFLLVVLVRNRLFMRRGTMLVLALVLSCGGAFAFAQTWRWQDKSEDPKTIEVYSGEKEHWAVVELVDEPGPIRIWLAPDLTPQVEF